MILVGHPAGLKPSITESLSVKTVNHFSRFAVDNHRRRNYKHEGKQIQQTHIYDLQESDKPFVHPPVAIGRSDPIIVF